jgi:hypothetical protein
LFNFYENKNVTHIANKPYFYVYLQYEKKKITVKDRLLNINFQYGGGVEFNYDSIQDEYHDEICKGDYCRCSTIETEMISVDKVVLSKIICQQFAISDHRVSQIDNICSKMTIDDFECQISAGYYGEEFDGIELDNSQLLEELENVIDVVKARYEKLKKIKLSTKKVTELKNILIKEYGYLLDSLIDAEYSTIEVLTSDIILPSKLQADNVGKKYLYSYKKHKICGIVRKKGDKYLVIDGYHRVTTNLKSHKIKVILIG